MLITLVAAALLGLIPAWIASSRGHVFFLWWVFGALLFIVALPMSIMLKKPPPDGPQAPESYVPLVTTMIIVLAVIGVVFVFGSSNPSPPDEISMAKFLAVEAGMNEAQVITIMGRSGIEMSRNEMEAVPGFMDKTVTVMYSWNNPNGSNMGAMFQNDKLITKAQFGLE